MDVIVNCALQYIQTNIFVTGNEVWATDSIPFLWIKDTVIVLYIEKNAVSGWDLTLYCLKSYTETRTRVCD